MYRQHGIPGHGWPSHLYISGRTIYPGQNHERVHYRFPQQFHRQPIQPVRLLPLTIFLHDGPLDYIPPRNWPQPWFPCHNSVSIPCLLRVCPPAPIHPRAVLRKWVLQTCRGNPGLRAAYLWIPPLSWEHPRNTLGIPALFYLPCRELLYFLSWAAYLPPATAIWLRLSSDCSRLLKNSK